MKENPSAQSALEALKVFVGILMVLGIEPLLTLISDDVPGWIWFIVAALISAAIMGLLSFFVFRTALITLAWTMENDPDPLVQVTAEIDPATRQTPRRARVEARVDFARGLGKFALRRAAKRGLTVNVKILASQLGVIVEDSDLDTHDLPLTARRVNPVGFDMTLPHPVPANSWGRVFIRFKSRTLDSRTTDIKYEVSVGGSRSIARFYEMLIRADSRASALREHWS